MTLRVVVNVIVAEIGHGKLHATACLSCVLSRVMWTKCLPSDTVQRKSAILTDSKLRL